MKKHKGLKIFGCIVAAVVLFFAVINLIPPKKSVVNNPFVVEKGELPMIAAHRGGALNNPESTLFAYREAVHSVGVEILEGDLYLTKDGYLVINHDSYVDETCNANGDISLKEVKELCKDKSARHYISDMTLDELFGEFYESHPELMFILEIKPGGERGFDACRALNECLEKYPEYRDRLVIGAFNDEIETELKTNYPELLRGAPMGSAAKFVFTQYLGVNLFDNGDFACLQIPTSYDVGVEIPLDSRSLVRRAHRRNIAVQYWTVNDAEEMRMLIEMGVDCIMTDDPALMREVLEEYK